MNNKKGVSALKKRILEEDDFIYCPRLGNSLSRLIDKNPDGVDDERIGKVLLISQEDFEKCYSSALDKLKKALT